MSAYWRTKLIIYLHFVTEDHNLNLTQTEQNLSIVTKSSLLEVIHLLIN